LAAACNHGTRTGWNAAIEERNGIIEQVDRLFKRMPAIFAPTTAGEAARVRMLIAHVQGAETRGPAGELDREKAETRPAPVAF
jgi:hypothetical protein